MDISHFRFILFNLKIFSEVVTTLILRYNNVRGPTFLEIQKHFKLREQSQS